MARTKYIVKIYDDEDQTWDCDFDREGGFVAYTLSVHRVCGHCQNSEEFIDSLGKVWLQVSDTTDVADHPEVRSILRDMLGYYPRYDDVAYIFVR